MSTKSTMPMVQVWIRTPVNYLGIEEKQREPIIDALLCVEGVSEVEHYNNLAILCNLISDSDPEAFCEIAAIRSRVQCVFESFQVWPEPLERLYQEGESCATHQ